MRLRNNIFAEAFKWLKKNWDGIRYQKDLAAKIGVSEDKYKYVARIYKDDILADNLLEKLNLSWDNRYFTDNLCKNVLELITSKGWHSYKEGNESITPTKRQRELAQSKSVDQKIKGVAGSGKTQVLAWRAVNAQVRTGGRVLVLTFNLTLVNYIKYRMSQVAADFNWSQFDITNYHQFFKSQANNHNLKPYIDDWDDENFFERYKNRTMRYDTILFDEAQDYRYAWYLVIKNSIQVIIILTILEEHRTKTSYFF